MSMFRFHIQVSPTTTNTTTLGFRLIPTPARTYMFWSVYTIHTYIRTYVPLVPFLQYHARHPHANEKCARRKMRQISIIPPTTYSITILVYLTVGALVIAYPSTHVASMTWHDYESVFFFYSAFHSDAENDFFFLKWHATTRPNWASPRNPRSHEHNRVFDSEWRHLLKLAFDGFT
jgi:hypothetical protein